MFEDEPKPIVPQAQPIIQKQRRRYQESKAIPYEVIQKSIEEIMDPMDKWLIATTYANGNRISETLALKFEDFAWDDKFLYIYSITKKKRNQTKIHKLRRNFPISRKLESWLTEPIIEFVNKGRQETPTSLIWPQTKRTSQNHIKKILGNKAHTLRHTRATHLINKFGFTIREVGTAFNISDRGLAEWITVYGHLERSHLENKWNSIQPKPVQASSDDSPFGFDG